MRWPIGTDPAPRRATRRPHTNDEPDPIPAQQPRVVLNQLTMDDFTTPQPRRQTRSSAPATITRPPTPPATPETPTTTPQSQGSSTARRSRPSTTPEAARGASTSAISSTPASATSTPTRGSRGRPRTSRARGTGGNATFSLGTTTSQRFRFVGDSDDDFETWFNQRSFLAMN